MLLTDNFTRLTYGLTLSPAFLDNKLQLNLSAKGVNDKNQFANGGALGAAVFFDPTQPVRVDGGPYGGYFTWLNQDGTPSTLSPDNPVALLEQRQSEGIVNRWILGAQVDYRLPFLEDLRANLNLGYDRSDSEGTVYVGPDAAFEYSTGGRAEEYTQEIKNELLEFFLDYGRQINSDFRLDVMGGYSWQHFFFENFFEATDATGEVEITPADVNPREYYLLSLFGRANLTLFDDFLLTFTLRRDGTSRFSEDNRWGTFPGAALAWKMVDNGAGTLSGLKLRLGYGLTGQQGINNDYYPYLARYLSSFSTAQYQFGNEYITTLRPNGYDANIKWEETTTYNAGIDYSLWDDRLSGAIDFYIRETEDLINFVPVPAGTNLTNFLLTNVGDLKNTGLEFALNAVPWRQGNKEWSLGFNVAWNKNEITRLTATDDPNYQGVFVGGISGGVGNNIQIHSVGFPAYSFFVFEQVYDENGVPVEGLYVDRNGDGMVTPEDQYRYEKAAPDAVFGFYTTLDLGKFDISTAARANVGNYVYNNNLANQAVYDFIFNASGGAGGGYLNNVHAQTQALDINSPRYFSDHYVVDGSFLRFDHITLGYDFGQVGKTFKNLRLYATVQNPILITNYDGIDPEISVRDNVTNTVTTGIDNNIYPRSRTFLFGVNAGF